MKNLMIALALVMTSSSAFAATKFNVTCTNPKGFSLSFKNCKFSEKNRSSMLCFQSDWESTITTTLKSNGDGTHNISRVESRIDKFGEVMPEMLPEVKNTVCRFNSNL